MKEKTSLTRKEAAPRNVAAKALREGAFRPKVEPDPKGYKRRPKHPAPPRIEDDDEAGG